MKCELCQFAVYDSKGSNVDCRQHPMTGRWYWLCRVCFIKLEEKHGPRPFWS